MMTGPDKIRLTRRDMLKLSAGGAGIFIVGASGLAVPKGVAGGNGLYIEAFPTSPLILSPFNEPLVIPPALRPVNPLSLPQGRPDPSKQDSLPVGNAAYKSRYGPTLGTHQLWPGQGVTSTYPWLSTTPLVYQIKLEVRGHSFTKSQV